MAGEIKGQTVVQQGGAGTTRVVNARQIASVTPSFSAATLQDPNTFVRQLEALRVNVDRVISRAGIFDKAIIFEDLALAAATDYNLEHGLGYPVTGLICIKAKTAAFTWFEQTLPSGVSGNVYYRTRNTNAGTFTLMVF